MDFSLSKKEILFQQMIRAFAEKEVKPLAAEVDEEERFPVETVEKMAHSNEIQLCLILLKQPQLLHFFLHKNNGIPDVKGGRREAAEESYIFSVIIEALIHVSDGTGFHSQKIGHRLGKRGERWRKLDHKLLGETRSNQPREIAF